LPGYARGGVGTACFKCGGLGDLTSLVIVMVIAAALVGGAAAAHLRARDLIDDAALRSIRLRHAFGRLIGNSDMHFGNLAFWFDDALPFRLAPAYDMLPMQWAPTVGDATPDPAFAPALPRPPHREIWQEASAWAHEFWHRVAANPLVTPAFAAIASRASETLARLRSVA
jgi:hypothetical protein